MADRKAFLAVLNEESACNFNEIMKKHYNNDDTFNIAEMVETLSKDQISSMWKNLLRFCSLALQGSNFEEGEDQQEELIFALETLQSLATVALNQVSISKPVITTEMFHVATVLHGILLSLPEDAAKLQNVISKLCEHWFHSDLSGKEELVSNTIIYLLARTHLHAPTNVDLKRVWDIRESLQLFDLEDESSFGLKELMQRCLMQALYLETELGRNILVYMFTLHPTVVEGFHRNIKNQIPRCQIVFLDAFNEVYFKAWKDSTGACKEKIESGCIQDLMHRAVYAKKIIFSRLESILMYIHKQKFQPEVAEMLYKLYQPILWRALKAANPLVRANAAAILIDVFPLQDPSAGVVENDDLKQMQLDAIAELLQDDVPAVRAIAVQGVCKICYRFWEFLPVATIKAYCTKLTEELAFDVSSVDVRVAVFKGLKLLANNRLSHSLLKNLLPNLRDLIHDNSQKVRGAFLDFLLLVKGIRTIKFWSVVPLKHLFATLEIETSTKCMKLIVKLLVNSYFPSKGNQPVKFENCLELMQKSRAAARIFFKFVCVSASLRVTANFIVLLCECVLECVRNSSQRGQNENEAANYGKEAASVASGDENSNEDGEEVNEEYEIDFTDSKLIVCMLDVLTISWLSIKRKFDKGSHATLKEKLVSVLSSAIPELLQHLEDHEAKSAIIVLASNLPPGSTSMISEHCLDALYQLLPESTSEQFGPVVQYLCSAGFAPDVLDHLCESFQKGLNQPSAQKKGSRKKVQQPSNQSSHLALHVLSWILAQPTTRDAILEQKDKCEKLHDVLQSSVNSLETLVVEAKGQSTKDGITKEREGFLAHCLSLSCRLRIHLQGKRKSLFEQGAEVTGEMRTLFTWMEQILLPEIDNYGGTSLEEVASKMIAGSKGTKRPHPDHSTGHNFGAFILHLLQNQLELASTIIILGMGTPAFNNHLADFIEQISTHASAIFIVPEMMQVAFHLTQVRSLNRDQGPDEPDPVVKIVKACFRNIHLAKTHSTGGSATQVLSTMRRSFTEILKSSFCSQAVFSPSDVSIMKENLATILDDVINFLNENEDFPKFDAINDMPNIASFILNVITKSKQLQRALFEEIVCLMSEDLLMDKWRSSSIVFLLDVLLRNGTQTAKKELIRSVLELKQFQPKISLSSTASELLNELIRKTSELANCGL